MSISTYTLSGGSAVFTSVGNTAITWLSVTNPDSTADAVDIHVVPALGTPDNTNLVVSNLSITADDTYQLYVGAEKLLLSDGDSVHVIATSSSISSVVISYTTI